MNFARDKDGDLVRTATFFAIDRTAAPMVDLQLRHHRNRWLGDPFAGSTLHEAHNLGDGPDGQEALVLETRRALGVLARARILEGVDAVANREAPGRVRVDTRYHDLLSGRVVAGYLDEFTG